MAAEKPKKWQFREHPHGREEKPGKKDRFDLRLLLWLALLVAAWLVFSQLAQQAGMPAPASAEKVTVIVKATDAEGNVILDKVLDVEKGKTAFDAMKQADPLLGYKEDATYGVFISSINGVSPGQGDRYWALYVDGASALTGVSGIKLNENRLIEWKIEGSPFGG